MHQIVNLGVEGQDKIYVRVACLLKVNMNGLGFVLFTL
jgi:hypothetical protein